MAIRDLISAVAIFLFAGAAFYLSDDYGEQAGMFPKLVAGIMMGASVLLFVRGLFLRVAEGGDDGTSVLRTVVTIVLTMVYVVAIVPVGYITSSIVYMLASMYFLGIRRFLIPGSVTVIFVFVLHFVFENVFHAPMPDDWFLKLF